MVLTQKIICEPVNWGTLSEKVYVRLNKNGHNVSIKQFTREYIKHLRPKVQATLNIHV